MAHIIIDSCKYTAFFGDFLQQKKPLIGGILVENIVYMGIFVGFYQKKHPQLLLVVVGVFFVYLGATYSALASSVVASTVSAIAVLGAGASKASNSALLIDFTSLPTRSVSVSSTRSSKAAL